MRTDDASPPAAAALDLVAQRIEAEIGLHFAGTRRRDLDAALRRMAAAQGFVNQYDCVRWLLAGQWDAAKTALCARFLTIGETYFFREPRALELVCDYARARLACGAARTPLRVWSAGCCTGEEPYSIAIALREKLPQLAPGEVSILATDLNEAFLDFARAGRYRQWSFRRTPPARRAAYFTQLEDGRHEVDPTLRAQVRFAQLNLASTDYPSAATQTQAIDIIFCRNVLMYFSRPHMKKIIARLRNCLVDGGWLVVNPSEASSELFEGFTPAYFPDAVFYRKTSEAWAQAMPCMLAKDPLRPVAARPAVARPGVAWPIATRPIAARPAKSAPSLNAPADATGDMLGRARALARGGDTGAALQCLRRAAESAPLRPELHLTLALHAFEEGDHRLARDSLRHLLYLQPDNALGHYLGAMVEHAEGRRAPAVRLLKTCAALLASVHDDDLIAGADGWPAARLRASVKDWLERAQ